MLLFYYQCICLSEHYKWREVQFCYIINLRGGLWSFFLHLIKKSFILKLSFIFSHRCSFCTNWLRSQVKSGIKFRGKEFYINLCLLSVLKPWQDLLLLVLQLKVVLVPFRQIPARTVHLLTLVPLQRYFYFLKKCVVWVLTYEMWWCAVKEESEKSGGVVESRWKVTLPQ